MFELRKHYWPNFNDTTFQKVSYIPRSDIDLLSFRYISQLQDSDSFSDVTTRYNPKTTML